MDINGILPPQSAPMSSAPASKGSNLSIDDFFSLLVAQLTNQDMYNTMDDTQFIAQMAQFSMVQALSDLSKASSTAYSVSLIGKEATVAQTNQDGSLEVFTGIVECVNLYNGSTEIMIDGKTFPLSSIMEVRQPNIIIPSSGLTPPTGITPPTGTTPPAEVTPPAETVPPAEVIPSDENIVTDEIQQEEGGNDESN